MSFFVELWESIFTPGTTPTMLLATNVTFGALQVVLLAMLAATHSIHCVVLSVLCAGLWWSVNWFAAELKAAQESERARLEEEQKQEGKEGEGDVEGGDKDKAGRKKKTGSSRKRHGEPDAGGSDTEVEVGTTKIVGVPGKTSAAAADAAASSVVETLDPRGELKKRGEDTSTGTQSSVSTEDEWEKVSASEKEKDK